jgi:hypothetical protein
VGAIQPIPLFVCAVSWLNARAPACARSDPASRAASNRWPDFALSPLPQTQSAAQRINMLLERRAKQEPVSAVRIGIKSRGCNGLSYTMDYATEKRKLEEEVNQHGAPSPAEHAAGQQHH